jgi:hypothetical protein
MPRAGAFTYGPDDEYDPLETGDAAATADKSRAPIIMPPRSALWPLALAKDFMPPCAQARRNASW